LSDDERLERMHRFWSDALLAFFCLALWLFLLFVMALPECVPRLGAVCGQQQNLGLSLSLIGPVLITFAIFRRRVHPLVTLLVISVGIAAPIWAMVSAEWFMASR
jgi:hypothetical protein